MPAGKYTRPSKVVMAVEKPPTALIFHESLGRRDSLYTKKLSEALQSGSCVKIVAGDAYLKSQFATAAKKLKVRLVFASDSGHLWIKPIAVEGELKRLVTWLREPRTVVELEGKRFELHLLNSLDQLKRDGLAHLGKQGWVLTEKGMDVL